VQIRVKGRNTPVPAALRRQIDRRFAAIGRQVSELAELEIELSAERNPAIPEAQVVEATLRLKGTTLRARQAARDATQALNRCEEELARQVKRQREKRRGRRAGRVAARPSQLPYEGTSQAI